MSTFDSITVLICHIFIRHDYRRKFASATREGFIFLYLIEIGESGLVVSPRRWCFSCRICGGAERPLPSPLVTIFHHTRANTQAVHDLHSNYTDHDHNTSVRICTASCGFLIVPDTRVRPVGIPRLSTPTVNAPAAHSAPLPRLISARSERYGKIVSH